MRSELPELEPWLAEAPVTLTSNRARKGDADFKAPLPTPGHGLPKPKKPKTRTGRKTKHAGKGPGGGRFIAGAGEGDGGETAAAVQQALSPSDKSGIQASIRAFQKKHGLKVDGIVGRQTALALSGKYTEARSTAPGRMGDRERNLLLQRHQPKARARASRPSRRARGGILVEGDREHHGAAQIALQEDQPLFGIGAGGKFWDPTLHPRGFGGLFQKKLKVGKKGQQHQTLIPEYDPKGLKFGKSAGGTTGARIAHHPDGTKWLVKTYGGNQDRVATELLANAVYRHMGARAARAGRIMLNNGKQALSYPLLEGKPKHRVFQRKGRDNRSAELGAHFMTDALLANWDVAGLDDDNVLWDPQGNPFRVDQGGTLEFRAQGSKKHFGPVPTEVSTMLMPGKGQAARSMLVTEQGLRLQAKQLEEQLTPGTVDALVDNAGFQDKAMRERVRKHLKARVAWMGKFARGEVGFPALQESELLQEMAKGFDFHWSPHDHPRDVHGKFVQTLFGLGTASGPKVVNLDSKTYIKRDKDNTFRVVRSGMIVKGFQSAEDAARAALDRSVKSTDADSVGGAVKHKDFNDYLKQRGIQNVDTASNASALFFGGKLLSAPDAQQELLALNARLANAEALGKEDKYVARAVPTIKARQAELISKMQAAGVKPPEQAGALKGQISHPEPTFPQPKAPVKEVNGIKVEAGQAFHKPGAGSTSVTYMISKVDPDGTVHVSWPGMTSSPAKYTPSQFTAAANTNAWKPGKHPAAGAGSPGTGLNMKVLAVNGVPPVGAQFKTSPNEGKQSTFVSMGVMGDKFRAKVVSHSSPEAFPPGTVVDWPVESAKEFSKGSSAGTWLTMGNQKWQQSQTAQAAQAAAPEANPQIAAKAAHGLGIGDKFHNSSGTTYEIEGSTSSQISAKKISDGPGQPHVMIAHTDVQMALDAGAWKKGPAPASATKPATKKFGKNAKQTNNLGNDYDPSGPAKLKDLKLDVGDKVQFKSGGYVYTFQGPSAYGAGMVFLHEPTGKKKQWAGHAKPGFVIKADGSELTKLEPGMAPPVGVAQTPGMVTPATPQGPKMTLDQLKSTLGTPPPMVTMGQLHDGDVIQTPDGKVGVMKPSEPAYTGYVSAYDIVTGQKFEPPASKPPHKFSNSPTVKKEAAEHLEKAQAGTQVSVAGTGAKATQTVKPAAASVGPPAQFHGVASWEAATQFIVSAGTQAAGLTPDEKSAIQSYTGSGYGSINAALRDSHSVKDLSVAKKAAAIKKALSKNVVKQDVWIGRQTSNKEWQNNAHAGKVIQDNGVISTSYTKGTWSGDIELNILVRAGSHALNVKSISQHSGENEVLLPPGSMFHVLKREEKGSKTVLYVEML